MLARRKLPLRRLPLDRTEFPAARHPLPVLRQCTDSVWGANAARASWRPSSLPLLPALAARAAATSAALPARNPRRLPAGSGPAPLPLPPRTAAKLPAVPSASIDRGGCLG